MSIRSRGPRAGKPSGIDFLAKAQAAWGDALPDWVRELAEDASRTSQVLAAQKIGMSAATVSYVIANKYGHGAFKGDLAFVEQKVRGALMGMTVACPVLGDIGRDHCLDEQKKPFAATSSVRSRLHRACRAGCPHSRLTKPE